MVCGLSVDAARAGWREVADTFSGVGGEVDTVTDLAEYAQLILSKVSFGNNCEKFIRN